jgi:hypothetical protein
MKRRKFVESVGVLAAAAYVTPKMVGLDVSNKTSPKLQDVAKKSGPDDGPNQPIGKEYGIHPGRVVWTWDPKATNPNCTNNYQTGDFFFKPEKYDQKVVGKMFTDTLLKLTGEKNVAKSWDALFKSFNNKKHNVRRGYTQGEKIFIKLNQTSARDTLGEALRAEGKYFHQPYDATRTRKQTVACETSPPLVLELLRHLVNVCKVKQSDIALGDPQNPLWGYNYDIWSKEFPNLVYTDNMHGDHGRTLIKPTEKDLLFWSDKSTTEKLYDVIEKADYMINVPTFKVHNVAGISICAKNHFGSHSRQRSQHLHYALAKMNPGYGNYRGFVDLMGSKYLGQNTMLFICDGLWGGGSSVTGAPVKYFIEPFNNNWSNSIFMAQDQVALDSVCYDLLRTEWNGINSHDPINNSAESSPNMYGVDDYLHQVADSKNWPAGITYDPDNSGKPLPSLGVHEHWNNPKDRQYSRNLGKKYGIELVTIPATLVKNA